MRQSHFIVNGVDVSNYPSVTEVLSPWRGDLDRIPAHVLQSAADRGTMVHEICAARATGVPYFADVPADCVGYVASFQRWLDAVVDEVIFSEKRIFSDLHKFHGQPDLCVTFRCTGPGSLVLVDLKTPKVTTPAWHAQVAAYRHLAEIHTGWAIVHAGCLKLDKDGGLPVFDEADHLDRWFSVFLAALTAYSFLGKRKET